MKHQRAIDDSEKIERRQHILQNAAALFQNTSYEKVSMLDVARLARLAKGTLYLYFTTKEELFLALLDAALAAWFADLQTRLAGLPQGGPAERSEAFANLLTDSLRQRTVLLRLLPLLHTVLEQNISYPAALEFKQRLRANLLETGRQIEARLGFLRAGQGAGLLLNAYAGLIGLLSMTQPSEVARQVLQLPEMALFNIDRPAELRQMVRRLLTGIYMENER